jgi:hypothetical protein
MRGWLAGWLVTHTIAKTIDDGSSIYGRVHEPLSFSFASVHIYPKPPAARVLFLRIRRSFLGSLSQCETCTVPTVLRFQYYNINTGLLGAMIVETSEGRGMYVNRNGKGAGTLCSGGDRDVSVPIIAKHDRAYIRIHVDA